ncbi:hypothetical protein LTR95_018866, partial [Oleoguttula sp. CCFEE 5521]
LDRTAILTKNKDALVASVLNPQVNAAATGLQSSLLPFLAKLFPGCTDVEAILRPRMPILLNGRRSSEEDEDDNEEEDVVGDEGELDELDVANSEIDEDVQASAEPDLLSALDEHLDSASRDNQEDVYNASPPGTTINAAGPGPATTIATSDSAFKRTTPHSETVENEFEQSSKRQRMTLDPETAPDASSTASAQPFQEPPAVFGAALTAAAAKALSDDGSDFELPPLTMEMDTESEDEEQEDDEDEGAPAS